MSQFIKMAKRCFDLLFSILGLIVLLPIFIIVAIWIKLDSKGSIFFRQQRVGKNGKLFLIHKFRTMYTSDQQQMPLTVGKDKRITRAGQFLRKSKADELPQLVDVIRGKMSLVGPRPEVPEFMNLYPESTKNIILSVRPGITDRAAIEMVDENEILSQYEDSTKAYIDVVMPMKCKHYLYYVDNQSIAEDISIILLTIWKIFKR